MSGAGSGLRKLTSKEETFCSIEELVLGLGVCDGIEAADSNNLLDGITRAIIGVRVSAQDAAQIGLQPVFFRSLELVTTLVDTVALYGARNLDLDAHVEPGEGIVTAVEPRGDFVGLVVRRVDEGVDVGGKTGGRGGIGARDVVIDSDL